VFLVVGWGVGLICFAKVAHEALQVSCVKAPTATHHCIILGSRRILPKAEQSKKKAKTAPKAAQLQLPEMFVSTLPLTST
jgi:hypothetical protein